MFAALVLLSQLLRHISEVTADPLQIQIPSQDQVNSIDDVDPGPDQDGDVHVPAHQDQGMDWLGQGPSNNDIKWPVQDQGIAADDVAPGPDGVDPILDPIVDPMNPDDTPDSGCQCRSMRRCVDCGELRPCPGENRSEGVSIIKISYKTHLKRIWKDFRELLKDTCIHSFTHFPRKPDETIFQSIKRDSLWRTGTVQGIHQLVRSFYKWPFRLQTPCRWSSAEGFSFCDTLQLFWRFEDIQICDLVFKNFGQRGSLEWLGSVQLVRLRGKMWVFNRLFCTDSRGKILFKFNFSYFGTRLANVKSPISQN